MAEKREKLTALLITYNEKDHIEEVIKNVSFADEIIIVDSHSTDGTIELIEKHPEVKLVLRAFKNYTDQKSHALELASYKWVVFPDADERIPTSLRNEILETINNPSNKAVAYYFKRIFMFKNKRLRFSGWQSDKNFRLFRKDKCHFTQKRIVHETLEVNGEVGTLQHKLIHFSYKNYEEYKEKMIKYGEMKAWEEFEKGKKAMSYHFILRPVYKFLNHYILRLGILDGRKGIIICYLNALGVYSRYKELKRLNRNTKA